MYPSELTQWFLCDIFTVGSKGKDNMEVDTSTIEVLQSTVRSKLVLSAANVVYFTWCIYFSCIFNTFGVNLRESADLHKDH